MKRKFSLTSQQLKLLTCIAEDHILKTKFYFVGGTALAYYYYQHRISDDIDFFSIEPVDGQYLNKFFLKNKEKLGFEKLSMTKIYDRNIFILDFGNGYKLKAEFTLFFKYLYPLHIDKKLGIKYIDKRDIILDKLGAMLDRTTEKDYFDFYRLYNDLYKTLSVRNLLNLADKVFLKRGINLSDSFFVRMCSIGYNMDYSPILVTKEVDFFDIKMFYYQLGNKAKNYLKL